ETNLRGTVQDRVTWLKFMEEQCERLSTRCEFNGFCWFPSIDSTDWCHACTRSTAAVDPQGIWTLDGGRWRRQETELSRYYSMLARGAVDSRALPAYRWSPMVAAQLKGFEPLMSHWDRMEIALD